MAGNCEQPWVAAAFIPDYSVKAVTDLSYIKIRAAQYAAARRATLLFQKHNQDQDTIKSMNQMDRDVEQVISYIRYRSIVLLLLITSWLS